MKKEALALARRLLKAPIVAAPQFADGVHAVLILADNVKSWKPLIEAAYERVPKRKRGSVRFWFMSVRDVCHDHAGVLRLVSGRFAGESALLELICAMEATFKTGTKELMSKLARRLPRLAHQVDDPVTNARMWLCLSEVSAREGNWDGSIKAADLARRCETLHREAVFAIVEIHVARALLEVRRGLDEVEEFITHYDPQTELMVPGNDRAVQDQAAKEFRRLQKILERIVPEKRQKELGFG